MLLSAVTLDQYRSAIGASELTLSSLKSAEAALALVFSGLPLWKKYPLATNPGLAEQTHKLFALFSAVVAAVVHGQDEISDQMAKQMVDLFRAKGVDVKANELRRAARNAAEDPKIYRATAMAEFIMRREPSVEALLVQIANHVPGLSGIPFPAAQFSGPIIGGPRQAEMVRLALQYTVTTPKDHILEIGYGTPAVLLGFSYYTGVRHLTGVDLRARPVGANEALKAVGIELVEGMFPDDPAALAELKTKAPFSVILAQDVIKSGTLETRISPKEFARHLYGLLEEGGTLVILNDYEKEPYFSRRQAEAAGFRVIRWGTRRDLPEKLKALIPYDPSDSKAGQMKAFILRKGEVRTDRLRLLWKAQESI